VLPGADPDEINNAFRTYLLQHRPDKDGEPTVFLNCHLAREVLLDAPPAVLARHVQNTWPCPAGAWVLLVGLRTESLNNRVGTATLWDGVWLTVQIRMTKFFEGNELVRVRRLHVRYPVQPPPEPLPTRVPWALPTWWPRPPLSCTPPPPDRSGPMASANAWAGGPEPRGSASASASASTAATDASGRETIACVCGMKLPVLPSELLIAARGKLVNLGGMMVLIRCWGGVQCNLQDRVIQCCSTTCPAEAGWVKSAKRRIWRCPSCRR
jgi:hypothetical protein